MSVPFAKQTIILSPSTCFPIGQRIIQVLGSVLLTVTEPSCGDGKGGHGDPGAGTGEAVNVAVAVVVTDETAGSSGSHIANKSFGAEPKSASSAASYSKNS